MKTPALFSIKKNCQQKVIFLSFCFSLGGFKINRKSFLVYFDWEAPLWELTDEELGELFRAMFIYAKYGELIDFEHRSLKLVFGFIKSAVDRDRAAYEERCKRNAENAGKGEKKKAEKEKEANLDFKALIGSTSYSD